MDHVKNLWSSYLQWVAEHPQLATDIETSIKWISYFATGYLKNSTNSLLWTELVYSASDLLKFINDRAYDQAFRTANAIQTEKIEHLLAFLDSAEMMLEIGSYLIGGNKAKWIAISSIQILKCTWRAIYVVKKKKLFKRQLFHQVNREEITKDKFETDNILPRSGRRIKSIDEDECENENETNNGVNIGPVNIRLWNIQQESPTKMSTLLNKQQIFGELTYVLQPLVHLSSLGTFGLKAWTPWFLSFVCDVLSQALHWDQMSNLTPEEKHELWRRRQEMVLYLLRSPLYDLCTKRLMIGILLLAKPNLPFSTHISDFLMAYIPHYRRIYAHIWSK